MSESALHARIAAAPLVHDRGRAAGVLADLTRRCGEEPELAALGALIAEPLFLLADTAMVGHLGATPLAGLGLASAVLQTIIGLMVFLAYATTPSVARRLGAGDERSARGRSP